jgi:uncharacterized protein with PQ loop repeat
MGFGMDFAMVAAPLITYFFQIHKFNKTKSSKGFSKFICFLLFMGNIFRIFFWFGTHFKITLLYQSLGIVIFQIILIHLCIKYQENPIQKSLLPGTSQNEVVLSSEKPLLYYLLHWKSTFDIKNIWRWRIEIEYYKFMFFVIASLFFLCQVFKNSKIFFHSIGVMSAFFEALCCVPQVIENYKTKNSKNVSFSMIFCWFLGDSFRLYYNLKYKAPIQMITAISVQVTLDFTVCVQLCIYSDNKSGNRIKIGLKKKKQIEEIADLKKQLLELNSLKAKLAEFNALKAQLGELNNLKEQVGQMNVIKHSPVSTSHTRTESSPLPVQSLPSV